VYYASAIPASPTDGAQQNSRGQSFMNAVVVQATPIVGDPPPDLVVATTVNTPTLSPATAYDPSSNRNDNGTSRHRLPSIFAGPTADDVLQQQQQRYQPRHASGRSHSPPQQRYYNSAPPHHQQRHSYCPPSIINNNFQQQERNFQAQQEEQQRQRQLQQRHSLNPMGLQQQQQQQHSFQAQQQEQPRPRQVQQRHSISPMSLQAPQQRQQLNDSLSGSSFHGHDIQSHQRHGMSGSLRGQDLPLPYGQDGNNNTIDFDRQRYYEMQQRQKNDMAIPSIFRPPA